VIQQNPLLRIESRIPFASVLPAHVTEALPLLIAQAQAGLAAIAEAAPGSRTYESTLLALEEATRPLDYAMAVASHLESVLGNREFRDAYNAVQAEVAGFYSGIMLNGALYAALQNYAETAEAKALSPVKARFLNSTLKDFRRNGAALSAPDRARVETIDVKLTEVTLKFSQNAVDAASKFEILLGPDETARLAGLPASALRAAEASAKEKGHTGYRLTLDGPSYGPAIMYLDDAALRERLYRASSTKASAAPFDNSQALREILTLRKEKATLLGFSSFADLVLENRMAKTGAAALAFVGRVRERVLAAFAKENAELAQFAARELGIERLQPWDIAYAAEKERKKLYDLDDETLRPYFELEAVMAGVFQIAERLYGIGFESCTGGPSLWDPEVREYRVLDASGACFGRFLLDLFPREGKRDGAWMHGLLDRVPGSGDEESVALIVGNMTKPQQGVALLTHREVQTVFHEFGHLLHHLLSEVSVRSLSGTKVAWDFVELPSQIMENFCFNEEALGLFARHYETGEKLPKALFERLSRARGYRAANAIVRQLGFATMDLELHQDSGVSEPVALARSIMQRFSATVLPTDYAMVTSFLHLFSSPVGYAAGYYSYQWAEVLDADAFALFQDRGVLSREAGESFRAHILSRGDSEDPAALFRAFRGREPDESAALRRVGLVP
jgi:oligopeptidase A